MKRLSSIFILFILLILPLNAMIPTQQRIRLTDSWEYLKGDLGSIWEAIRPADPGSSEAVPIWQQVTLPHCFNAEDAVDPDINYYQGAGWYRTQLSIKNPYLNGRILLEFEGAGPKTEVYVYTYKVASHTGGYDGWSVDITEAVQQALANPDCAKRFNGRIPLSVRCDNTRDTEMIPSDLSDFNLYGGLYRYVNLIYQPEVSFSNIQIETPVEKEWNYTTPDGKNIDKGIAWLYPYVKDKSSWKRQPDIMFWEEWPVAQPFLLFGTLHHFNKEYFKTWMQLEHFPTNEEVVRNLPIRHPLLWIQ